MFSVRTFAVAALTALGIAACGEAPTDTALAPDQPSFASSGPVLVECPVESAISTTGTLGPLGGALRLLNHELSLPLVAVNGPTHFRLEAPVSNYMELAVMANDAESFQFNKVVTITIDYSRCTRSNIDKAPLSVWQVDPVTKALIEHMGGVDDKVSRTITFQTDHLSTYSIAQ